MLPNFIIAGAQKCGTTFLHHALAAHSDVFLVSRPQELHYFDLDENFERGLGWYESHFNGAAGRGAVGQTSPLYLYEPAAAGRIHETLPQVKLIFILRNPIDRAYSHYWHAVRYGWERLDFADALAREASRIAEGGVARRRYSYLDRGRYAKQLERYFERFSADQILVVLNDDLDSDPGALLARCATFLGIDAAMMPTPSAGGSEQNLAKRPRWPSLQRATSGLRGGPLRSIGEAVDRINLVPFRYPEMDEGLRRELGEALRADVAATGERIGEDLISRWL